MSIVSMANNTMHTNLIPVVIDLSAAVTQLTVIYMHTNLVIIIIPVVINLNAVIYMSCMQTKVVFAIKGDSKRYVLALRLCAIELYNKRMLKQAIPKTDNSKYLPISIFLCQVLVSVNSFLGLRRFTSAS